MRVNVKKKAKDIGCAQSKKRASTIIFEVTSTYIIFKATKLKMSKRE